MKKLIKNIPYNWPLNVTLTLKVGVQVLYLTYRFIIVTICA
jgi:hypothetical protein